MNDKPKVLTLAGWYPNRINPYLGTFVQRQTEAAAMHADMCVLFCTPDATLNKKYEIVTERIRGVETIIVYYRKTSGSFPVFASVQKFFRFFFACCAGWKNVKNHFGKPDILHINILWPSAIFVSYLKIFYNIPFLLSEHWSGYLEKNGAYQRMNFPEKKIMKYVANRAAVISPVSNVLMRAMQQCGFRSKYEVIHNVVDISTFYPDAKKKRGNPPVFLHVSTLDEDAKNVFGILRTIKKLHNEKIRFSFHIISEKNFSIHSRYAEQIGIPDKIILWEGPVNREAVAAAMRKADCFVLFSNYETVSVVMLEALASCLPVIATAVGGIPDHLHPGFGILIPPRDENALLDAMKKIIDGKLQFDIQGMRKYAVENFSYEAVGQKYKSIYNRILKRNDSSS